MAKSKYEYVKNFELDDTLLPSTYIICRIDGRSFHKFTNDHHFIKPNDDSALLLMNKCAQEVMKSFTDIIIAIGMSDEFSFVFKSDTTIYNRRESKINSTIVSQFTSCYVYYWNQYLKTELKYPPQFDARIVCYPNEKVLYDYLCWRQVDCHINNLYNTCFWNLVQSGSSLLEAEATLKVTDSAAKNELLFSKFQINYNNLPAMHRKGSILIRNKYIEEHCAPNGRKFMKEGFKIELVHEDLISLSFWDKYKILSNWPPLDSSHKKSKINDVVENCTPVKD